MSKQMKFAIGSALGFFILAVITYPAQGVIEFSHATGFYDQEFLLEIEAPTTEIYYTLDGSIPTKESNKYIEPIFVYDASINENTYSMRKDVVADSLNIVVEDENLIITNEYEPTSEKIDKCTILRVVYYDNWGKKSDVITNTYFVGFDDKIEYNNIPIISLVTEPDNLFGYEEGIYVLGKTFDEFCQDCMENDPDLLLDSLSGFWEANYTQRGSEWEREAEIFFFDENRTLSFDKDMGIRVQGATSRAGNPKSLNAYSRYEYDSTDSIEYDIWETGYNPDQITFTTGGGDKRTITKDRLAADLASELAVATMNFKPCNVFINGEYWGNYYITEKYSDKYFSYYYNIPEDNVVYIKAGEVEVGNDKDQEEFNKFLGFAKGTDFTDEDEYNNLWDLLDKESTIDYFAYLIYLSRYEDWIPFELNSGIWKSRKLSDSEYGDGKYRWVIYDMNSKGFTESFKDFDSIAYVKENSIFFCNLCKNSDFTDLLWERIIELGDTIFLEENVNSMLDGYISEVGESMKLNVERFPGRDDDTYYDGIDNYRKFFEGRSDYIEQYAQIHFE